MGTVHTKRNCSRTDEVSIDPGTDLRNLRIENCYSFKPFEMVQPSNVKAFLQTKTFPKKTINPPKPRSGHRIVCDAANMYCFGGYLPETEHTIYDNDEDDGWSRDNPLFKEFWKFNLATSTWTKIHIMSEFPKALVSNAVYLSGKILMILGGTGFPFGIDCNNSLKLCDISQENPVFSEVPTKGNPPLPQYGQAIVLYDHYLYSVGGTTGFDYTSHVHRLDLKSGLWESMYISRGRENEPHGMYRHEVVCYKSKIYLFGGGTNVLVCGFKVLHAFDILKNDWEVVTTFPDAQGKFPGKRFCHSCVQIPDKPNKVVIISGVYRSGYGDVWMIDLNTCQWTKLACSLPEVYFHSSAITPWGKLLTFGGVVKKDGELKRISDLYACWLSIPKLKEICWDAIVYYYPYLNKYSCEELLAYGVPYEFVKRID